MADDTSPPSVFVSIRNAFVSGVLLLAPLIVTVWAVGKIIDLLGGTFRPIYQSYIPAPLQQIPLFWDIIATLVVLMLITALGYLSQWVFGKVFLSIFERAIRQIPGIGAVYNSVKQIVSTFGSQNRNLFSKVVLVEFPREGAWSVGFLTNKTQAEPHRALGTESWTVFVPTSPNPTGGFLLILPKEKIRELDMSVADGMKMIISGGAVTPPWPAPGPTVLRG